MKPLKTMLLIFAILVLTFCLTVSSFAHPGRTDSRGGHNSPSGYHYHHGYPAHHHTNGVCPYNYDDKTNHDNNNSSGSITNDISTEQHSYKTPTVNKTHISGADILSSILVLVIIGINIYLLAIAVKERPRE